MGTPLFKNKIKEDLRNFYNPKIYLLTKKDFS